MLILDGHNSHTTYHFCSFAEKHNIIVLCLPSHTTHHLQPCDMGVFGPLNSTWKAEVNKASCRWIPIQKTNLLAYYAQAHTKAFTSVIIHSAFKKTGIHPFNQEAIEDDAFALALNTTMQATQPVSTTVPDLLVPSTTSTPPDTVASTTETSSGSSQIAMSGAASTTSTQSDKGQSGGEVKCILANVPSPLSSLACRESILLQYAELQYLLDCCCTQMHKDYAPKKLMDKENGHLQKRLYDKTNKHRKKVSSGFTQHMTSEKSLDALARDEWASEMKEVFKDQVWKAWRDAYEKYVREMVAEQKQQEKEVERVQEEAEKMRRGEGKRFRDSERRRSIRGGQKGRRP